MSVIQRINGLLVVVAAVCLLAARQDGDDAAADTFFKQQVLPVLQANCFKCHGPAAARAKGGLRMTGRDALLKGGESGPALVPGNVEASLLVKAIRRTDPDLEMPPKTPLPEPTRLVLEKWVADGAHWPADALSGGGAPSPGGAGNAGGDGATAGNGAEDSGADDAASGARDGGGAPADGSGTTNAEPAPEMPALPPLSEHDALIFF